MGHRSETVLMLVQALSIAFLCQLPTPADEGVAVTHDYCRELAELAHQAPPEQRAWPRYLETLVALGCVPDELGTDQ